jgi:hypothetical protein
MAAMGESDRARCAAQFARDNTEPTSITKADLRAALNAADDWIEANAAAYNSALPQPARSALSSTQKTLLFVYVAMRRRGLLHAEEDG